MRDDIQLVKDLVLKEAMRRKTESLGFMGGVKDEVLTEINGSDYFTP
jgi:hypothetical protein